MAERDRRGRWLPGESPCPGGGPKRKIDQLLELDIKIAARAHCQAAIDRLAQLMRSKDEKIAYLASCALIERGFGKPLVTVDTTTVNKFVVAPATITNVEEWLACRGNPTAVEPKRLCRDAISEANTIDLKVADDKPN